MVVCIRCGAYSQGCKQRSKLGAACAKTERSLATLRTIRRGQHPRWPDARVVAFAPVLWGESRAEDEGG